MAMYHISSLAADAPSCNIPPAKGAKEAIEATAKEAKPSAQNLFYALGVAKNLGIAVVEGDFVNAITTAMKDGSASR